MQGYEDVLPRSAYRILSLAEREQFFPIVYAMVGLILGFVAVVVLIYWTHGFQKFCEVALQPPCLAFCRRLVVQTASVRVPSECGDSGAGKRSQNAYI